MVNKPFDRHSGLYVSRQVIMVGDFNVAMTPKDVHPTISFEGLYSKEELEAMRNLMADYIDVWRELHPDTADQFTV